MNETNQADNAKFLVPGAVVVAGLLVAGAIMWNNQGNSGVAAGVGAQPAAAVAVDIAKVSLKGEAYIGQANAPVTIAFWSDFQCPFCKQFELNTLPQIIQKYVDTGKVKVIFKDFEFLGPDSDTAALYALAVWDLYPAQYMTWRTAMYTAQDDENAGFGDVATVEKLTKGIAGIDLAKVKAAVTANHDKYEAAAAANRAEAQAFGISATPSFVIGKQMIAGAQPIASFTSAIDALLKK